MDILFIHLFAQSFLLVFNYLFFNRVDLCVTDHEIGSIKCIQHCFITSLFSMLFFAAHYQDVTKILQSFGKMTKSFSGNYCVWFYQHCVYSVFFLVVSDRLQIILLLLVISIKYFYLSRNVCFCVFLCWLHFHAVHLNPWWKDTLVGKQPSLKKHINEPVTQNHLSFKADWLCLQGGVKEKFACIFGKTRWNLPQKATWLVM